MGDSPTQSPTTQSPTDSPSQSPTTDGQSPPTTCVTSSAQAYMYTTPGSTGWGGMDMPGQSRKVATSTSDCQAKCGSVSGCAFFTYWPRDGGCHCQRSTAMLRMSPTLTPPH